VEQEKAEAARQAAIKYEQEQLAARKAEEARREAEKQEKLAREKEEREKAAIEAARQAAIKLEQEQLAARKAEEARREAERQEALAREKEEREKAAIEATRQAILKREQEELAARKAEEARKALLEAAPAEKADNPLRQPEAPVHAAESQQPSSSAGAKQVSGDDDATDQPPATIMELYLAAKANDPVLRRSEAKVSGSKADSDVLLSTLLPHLDSSAGIKQISQTLSNYTPNDVNNNYSALNYNVTARMTLLHVPTLYSLSAAAAGISIEQAGVVAARQNLIVKLTDSYFSLLKAQVDKQIALGEINRLKLVLDQSKAFLKAGTGDIIAVYEAQSRLDSASADLTRSESTLRLAEQKLSTVVGKPVRSIVNYLPRAPEGPNPDNLDWWVATMEREQPAIRQAREGLTQTSEQRKAAKAEYFPILQASGGYDVNRGTAALPTAEVRQWFVGASISLPLYSGGETAAKVRRAVASEEERRLVLDETMDQQRESVKQAFYNLRYNISFIKALEQKKASAEIQLAAVSKGRKIGTRNAVDVLNAEQAYSIALRDHQYALYDNFIRVIQLKSAAGILAEEDVTEVSRAVAPFMISKLNSLVSSLAK
jgi:outer membrane protein